MIARTPDENYAAIRAGGLPDELNRWRDMTPDAAAAYERHLRELTARASQPRMRRFKERDRPAETSIEAEADRLWRNWAPTVGGRTSRRPQLRTFVRLVRKQRARAERDAARALARQKTPAPAPAAATTEGDSIMGAKHSKTTKATRKAKGRKTKVLTATKQRAAVAENAGEVGGRRGEVIAFITGKPRTAAIIGAEFGLMEKSVRAMISGINKPVKDGGLGIAVKSEKNAQGVTEYSIAKA